ncbi:MAG TPA: hypothetical protein VKG20_03990 [Methylomirabilota bacterium]|nr:hypothetical protein [Methylomirabilota bacterium]
MPTAPRPNSLQQAASAVFAVTTVVPLLIFVWTLHRVGSLSLVQSQVGLGLALGIALLGYYIFRRLMGQMSDLIRGLGRVVERGSRTTADSRLAASAQERAPGLIAEYKSPTLAAQAHTAPSASAPRPVPAQPRGAAAPAPIAAASAAPVAATSPAAATVELAEVEAPRGQSIPGLGMIQEVDDLSRAMAKLWMGEAIAYKDRRVAVSIMNSRTPITGTLVEVTLEGLLIDQDGGKQVAVSFSRLSGIDAA